MNRRTLSFAACLAICAGCGDQGRSVVVSIISDLLIGPEVDELTARLFEGFDVLVEGSYALGTAPRDDWPQTLPIIAGEKHGLELSIVVELRGKNVLKGTASAPVSFPEAGSTELSLGVPRDCPPSVDGDGDGFGNRPGCKGLDCDDNDKSIPETAVCPDCVDGDGDTYGVGSSCVGTDCDDNNGSIWEQADCDLLGCGVVCPSGEICSSGACRTTCQLDTDCEDSIDYACQGDPSVCQCRWATCTTVGNCPSSIEYAGRTWPVPANLWSCTAGCCDSPLS